MIGKERGNGSESRGEKMNVALSAGQPKVDFETTRQEGTNCILCAVSIVFIIPALDEVPGLLLNKPNT
jgi:hypothetical protein